MVSFVVGGLGGGVVASLYKVVGYHGREVPRGWDWGLRKEGSLN